jgi:hypothetical protein
MLVKSFITSLLISTILIAGTATLAQDDGNDGARDIFLSTRPESSSSSNSSKNTVKNGNKSRHSNNLRSNKKTSIGLGYTLYIRGSEGRPERVAPEREFKTGDRVRIMLEPNVEGYLYVFHTENNSEPQMLFPDARLSGGKNSIKAHVPYEVPLSFDQDSDNQWFVFEGEPATERLYIVVSRKPLSGVPIGNELIRYCGSNLENCVLRPTGPLWAEVKAKAEATVNMSKSKTQGQAQSSIEKDSIGKSISLNREAPTPSVIRICNSSEADMLVTLIDLIHK